MEGESKNVSYRVWGLNFNLFPQNRALTLVFISSGAAIRKADGSMDLSGRRIFVKVGIGNLKMESIGKGELFLFNLLSFRLFWNSPNGKAMPLLPGNPAWLAPVIAIPYMLVALSVVYNFGEKRYFIKEGGEVAGTVIMKSRQDAWLCKAWLSRRLRGGAASAFLPSFVSPSVRLTD